MDLGWTFIIPKADSMDISEGMNKYRYEDMLRDLGFLANLLVPLT